MLARGGAFRRMRPWSPQKDSTCVEEGLAHSSSDNEKTQKPIWSRFWNRPGVRMGGNYYSMPTKSLLAAFLLLLGGALQTASIRQHGYLDISPRYVQYDVTSNLVSVPAAYLSEPHQVPSPPLVQQQDQRESSDDASDEESNCVPMHDWMTSNEFFSCPRMHEIDMMPRPDSLIFINCGGDRCVFKLIDWDGILPVGLKVQKFRRSFTIERYEHARRDAAVMERLTSSHYVANIYGACGTSQVVEYSSGGNIHDLVKEARLAKKDAMTPLDKLKVATQIATAVADMHTFEPDGVTSLAHNDMCCHQFILVDGVYKLNDFHLSSVMTKEKTTGEACPEHPPDMNSALPKVRAPEEQPAKGTNVFERVVDRAKIDVYLMGNVMYYVLTKQWIMEGESMFFASRRIAIGYRSPYPEHIRNSQDPADQAVMAAIEECWTHHYPKRPTARQVSDMLKEALFRITGEREDVVRVSIPPLPKHHRYTDSDWWNNLYGPRAHSTRTRM